MITVVATVAPVFILIALGFAAGRTSYVSGTTGKVLVEFAFRVAIPALLFRTMATLAPPEASPFALWGAFFGSILASWLLATLASRLLLRQDGRVAAVHALGASFGNLVLLGLPLALSAFGPAAATPMALIFLVEFPLMWLAATLQFHLARGDGVGLSTTPLGPALGAVARDLVRNPIILAIAAGVAWRLASLPIPETIDKMLTVLGQSAVPASLFALGLSLATLKPAGRWPAVNLLVVIKLAVLPAVAMLLAFHVFELPVLWAQVVVLFAAMPTGAVAFLFATRHETEADTIAAAIAISVAVSMVSISIVLYCLTI